MFSESHNIDTFYVEETEYNLEALYYRQETWVGQLEWHEKEQYLFHTSKSLDLGECSHILLFLNRYLDVLHRIQEQMDTHDKVVGHVDKLVRKITTMRNTMTGLVSILLE
jgi:hypothetical protein